jgi:radical SAM superfamily enzyme YgiQ (UPF0313 family)
VRVLLISTYDLGRQPLGLAGPAAWLRQAGIDVDCVDTSRDELSDEQIAGADLVAFYLPMHTATRLAGPLVQRARRVHPRVRLVAYGLYAPLNETWLRERGVNDVLGPEPERDLVRLAGTPSAPRQTSNGNGHRLAPAPDRTTLVPLARYAMLQMPDGTRRVTGSTDATRGCKHLCRHCPIVPVYHGRFTAIPVDTVIADVRAQVEAGATHISFGDPDFFNGPTHGRRIVERLARECPGLTYDVTIKVEHLLKHRAMLPLLRETGCLFVTSAVESVDDEVLLKLRKGHTRADFIACVELCRSAGVALAPTFVPFTPWTTIDGYRDLLHEVAALDLIDAVAPIQFAIRLLVTAESMLLELPDIRAGIGPFDPGSLSYPWRHADTDVDRLQQEVMRIVGSRASAPRRDVFAAIADRAGLAARVPVTVAPAGATPYMTEAWYCCAEPGPEQVDLL